MIENQFFASLREAKKIGLLLIRTNYICESRVEFLFCLLGR